MNFSSAAIRRRYNNNGNRKYRNIKAKLYIENVKKKEKNLISFILLNLLTFFYTSFIHTVTVVWLWVYASAVLTARTSSFGTAGYMCILYSFSHMSLYDSHICTYVCLCFRLFFFLEKFKLKRNCFEIVCCWRSR